MGGIRNKINLSNLFFIRSDTILIILPCKRDNRCTFVCNHNAVDVWNIYRERGRSVNAITGIGLSRLFFNTLYNHSASTVANIILSAL